MTIRRFAASLMISLIILLSGCGSPATPITTPPPYTTPPADNITPPVAAPPVTTPPAANTTPPVATPPVTPPPGNIPVRGPNDVWIQGFTFTPQVLTVAAGTKVTWTNKDNDPHDVTSDPPGLYSGQLSGNGGSYSYTFDSPGTYDYVCTIHPGMSGKIVVQ